MSQYYHEFTVGFNWWFIVAPLFLVAMIAFEVRAFRMDFGNLRIYRTHNDRATLVLSGLFTMIVTALVVAESGTGIVQFFLNGLGKYEDPFWSILGFVILISGVFIMYWTLLFYVGKVSSYAKRGYLCEKKGKIMSARKRQQKVKARKNFLAVLPDADYPNGNENPRA